MMIRRIPKWCGSVLVALAVVTTQAIGFSANAATTAPGRFIESLGENLMARVTSDPKILSGDNQAVRALVDELVLPVLAFEQMTASSVGPAWRSATPAQRTELQNQFKLLLVRTYAGALKHLQDKRLVVFPVRMAPEDSEVTVRSEIQGVGSEPVPIAYRLSREGDGWIIFDINVVGIWLVETYRTQFAQQIQKTGVDGLIVALRRLNGNS